MIRILMPLAIVAAMFFGPMYSYPSTNPVSGQEENSVVTGSVFIGNAIACLRELKTPLGEECASEGKISDSTTVGTMMSWAAVLSIAAAAVGILGLIPFVGRVTSIVTILAGLAGLGAMGLFIMTMMSTSQGLPGVQWGAYLAAGAALLTTISGLSGMRGR